MCSLSLLPSHEGDMKILTVVLLLVAGLINLYPLIGVISVDQLNALYGLEFLSSDHIILMRHRAVLFGLLGGLILYSIWQPRLRFLACVYGLISMIAFVVLAFAHPSYGQALHKVVIADIVASAGLVVVLMLELGLSRKAL